MSLTVSLSLTPSAAAPGGYFQRRDGRSWCGAGDSCDLLTCSPKPRPGSAKFQSTTESAVHTGDHGPVWYSHTGLFHPSSLQSSTCEYQFNLSPFDQLFYSDFTSESFRVFFLLSSTSVSLQEKQQHQCRNTASRSHTFKNYILALKYT